VQESRAAQGLKREAHWRARPGRKIPGKKTFQIQQQSIPNFSEISGLQCVNYSSKIQRNYTRKLGTKMETFGCLHNSQLGEILDFRQINPAIKMHYFKEILSLNSLNLRLARINIFFWKHLNPSSSPSL